MLIICLLFSLITHAQGDTGLLFSLTESDEGGWQVEFRPGRVSVGMDDRGFVSVEAAGMASMAPREGLPSLPQVSRLLVLPRGSEVAISELEAGEPTAVRIAGRVQPYAGSPVKEALPVEVKPDYKVYEGLDAYSAGDLLTVEALGMMGERQLVRLTTHPVEYRPADSVVLFRPFTAALTVTLAEPPLSDGYGRNRYLVVSRPQFREGLQPFVRWKEQEGYEVVEVYANTNKRDSIKELIHPYFLPTAGRWPQYLLLVGDAGQLQAFLGTTHPTGLGNHVTDLYYAEHTGDYFPDALVGRWPVNDTAELGIIVRKTLAYEQYRNIDTTRLKRVLLVAGAEDRQPAPVTTNGQVNYVGREVRMSHPSIDTLCYRNPASSNQRGAILSDISQGVSMLNYTAHCTAAGWSSPSVTFTSLDTLNNPQPMLYVNNCCLSNAFDGTCFGEQLLRKAEGGAIGVVGATNSTLWNEDYYWAVGPKYPFSLTPSFELDRPGAFDCWLGRVGGVRTQGELLAAGNMSVTSFGSPYDKFYWETYCLLGDPSLVPWVGVPQVADVHVASSLHDGVGSVTFGGTPGVTVTVMQHDTVTGVDVIGVDGSLTLELCSSLDTTPLVVTASGAGCRPRVDTLEVEAVAGIGVALREVEISDTMIRCRVENVGTEPLEGLRVVLGQQGADSTVDALVAGQSTEIDTLLPHQSRSVMLPVEVHAIGQRPWWRARLVVRDSLGSELGVLALVHEMQVVYPTAVFRLLKGDGGEAHRLLPTNEYSIETVVNGTDATLGLVVTALPTKDTLVLANPDSPVPSFSAPFITPDTMTHVRVEAAVGLDNYRKEYDYYLVGGGRTDGFESGLDCYPWRQGGTRPWQVDGTVSHSGHFSARSGPIDYRQTSDLILEVLLPQRDTLSYWARTSSEATYDKMVLLVDGARRGSELWGEVGWRHYEVVLDAGRHTLCWRYVKDENGSAGEDCAWIDDVRLPLALWDSAYGCFDDDAVGMQSPAMACCPLRIFPNPTSGMVTVDEVDAGTLNIIDLYGRVVYTTRHSSPSTYNLAELPNGFYLLQVVTETGSDYKSLLIRR